MTRREDRKPNEIGGRSPATEEAKDQALAGRRGAEAEGGAAERQPSQSSNRRGARHEEPPHVRRGFQEGQAPSDQGDRSSPSPERIAQDQQGMKGGSGSHAAGDRSQEEAVSGEPKGDHTRSGRQSTPGDRPRRD